MDLWWYFDIFAQDDSKYVKLIYLELGKTESWYVRRELPLALSHHLGMKHGAGKASLI